MIRKSPKPDRFILRVIDKTPKKKKSKSRSKSKSPKKHKDKVYSLDSNLEESREIINKIKEDLPKPKPLVDSNPALANNINIIHPIEVNIVKKGHGIEYPIDKFQSKIEVTKTIAIKSPDNVSNRTNLSKQMRWSPKNITYTYDPKKSIINSDLNSTKVLTTNIPIINKKPIYSKLETSIERNSRPLISPRAQKKIDSFINRQYLPKPEQTIAKNTIDMYKENSSLTKLIARDYKNISIKTNIENFKKLDPLVIDYSLLDRNIDKLCLFNRLPEVDDRYICIALSNGLTINKK